MTHNNGDAIVIQDNELLLRPLSDFDKVNLARLASNRKVWDNLRDSMPYPYAETDANFSLI